MGSSNTSIGDYTYTVYYGNAGLPSSITSGAFSIMSALDCRSNSDLSGLTPTARKNAIRSLADARIGMKVRLQEACQGYSQNGLPADESKKDVVLAASSIDLANANGSIEASPFVKLKFALNVELERRAQFYEDSFDIGNVDADDDWDDLSVLNGNYTSPAGQYIDHLANSIRFKPGEKAAVYRLVSNLSAALSSESYVGLPSSSVSSVAKSAVESVLSNFAYSSGSFASKASAGALVLALSVLQSECMCYTDCDGYSVCYCYNHCNNY